MVAIKIKDIEAVEKMKQVDKVVLDLDNGKVFVLTNPLKVRFRKATFTFPCHLIVFTFEDLPSKLMLDQLADPDEFEGSELYFMQHFVEVYQAENFYADDEDAVFKVQLYKAGLEATQELFKDLNEKDLQYSCHPHIDDGYKLCTGPAVQEALYKTQERCDLFSATAITLNFLSKMNVLYPSVKDALEATEQGREELKGLTIFKHEEDRVLATGSKPKVLRRAIIDHNELTTGDFGFDYGEELDEEEE